MDSILFSLLILRGLCDSQGRVWRYLQNQIYAVEVTLPKKNHNIIFSESRTVSLMELMPSVFCPSPETAFDFLKAEILCRLHT